MDNRRPGKRERGQLGWYDREMPKVRDTPDFENIKPGKFAEHKHTTNSH